MVLHRRGKQDKAKSKGNQQPHSIIVRDTAEPRDMLNASSLPLSAMETNKPTQVSSSPNFINSFVCQNPPQLSHHLLSSVSGFFHHLLSRIGAADNFHRQWLRCGAEIGKGIEVGKSCVANIVMSWPSRNLPRRLLPFFATISQDPWQPKHVFDIALSAEYVAKTLAGTAVYTVSNSNNEFVLISDPNSLKSLGLLCFRQEDAEALLAQVQLRQPILGRGAKVVPITLDQVYMLKVEGIAFRFLPDPAQIRNALELKPADLARAFDGVPIFQSDLLVIKKKNKRYCPLYFQKEDIERELAKTSKASRGSSLSQHIMVGSLEDVLKKMEMNKNKSGWEDLIFIPPGKSYSQHIKEVAAA